jgi:hypothetical protein
MNSQPEVSEGHYFIIVFFFSSTQEAGAGKAASKHMWTAAHCSRPQGGADGERLASGTASIRPLEPTAPWISIFCYHS